MHHVFVTDQLYDLLTVCLQVFFGSRSTLLTFGLVDFSYVLVILSLKYFSQSYFSALYKLQVLSAGTITLLVHFICLISFASCSWKVLLTLRNSIFLSVTLNHFKNLNWWINSAIVCVHFRDSFNSSST